MTETLEAADAPPAERVRPGRDFTRLLSAYSVQTLGEGVLVATLPLLASHITSDARLISGVALAQELPWLVLALPGGVIIDRFDRRRLMIGTQAAQATMLAVIALFASFGHVRIWMLFLLAFGLGSGDILFTGASRAVIPTVVPDAALETANGRNVTAETIGRQFIGPPLGSALFVFLLPLPFWFDAVTYALSLLLIFRVRGEGRRFHPASAAGDRPAAKDLRGTLSEATSGLWLIGRHPVLRAVVLLAAANNFTVYMAQPLLVLFAKKLLHIGNSGYGILVAAMAIGGVIGALVSRRTVKRFGARAVALTVSTVSALSLVAIGMAARGPVTLVVLFCFWSAGLSLWNVMAQSVSMRLVPDELRGRVSTSSRMICFGALPLGALAGGMVADAYGLRATWVVGGVIMLAVTLLCVPTMMRWPSSHQAKPAHTEESA